MANPKPIIYLICGMVCSGKTIYAKKLENEQKAIRFNTDEWISAFFKDNLVQKQFSAIEKDCQKLIQPIIKKLLQNNVSVILDFGFWKKSSRLKYKKLADKMGAESVLYFMNCSKDIQNKRRLKRNKHINKNLIITDKMFSDFLKEFEKPSDNEGIKIIEIK